MRWDARGSAGGVTFCEKPMEREYLAADRGRLKTRVQAFMEKIHK